MTYWACLAGEGCSLVEYRNLMYFMGSMITVTSIIIWMEYRRERRQRKRWEEYYRIRDETPQGQPDGRRKAQRAKRQAHDWRPTRPEHRIGGNGTERLRHDRHGDRIGTGEERAIIKGDTRKT